MLKGTALIIGFVPQEKVGVVALTNIAQLPYRDVLLYDAIDRALDLPDRQWNKKFHDMFDPIIAGQAKAKDTAKEEKIVDAPPSHALDTYIGSFEADGYPDFAVRQHESGLQACLAGSLDWSEMRHYHYDVFEWHLEDFDFLDKSKIPDK